MTLAEDLIDFIESLGLRYFRPSEFLVGITKGNTLPPKWRWHNIALNAVIVDEVRHHYRRRTDLTSVFRSIGYNRSVGGVELSQHIAFAALDFKVKGVAPSEVAALLTSWRGRRFEIPIPVKRVPVSIGSKTIPFHNLDTWRLVGGESSLVEYRGGIGIYNTFTHNDTRGRNLTFRG